MAQKFGKFADFCQGHNLCALPAQRATLYRYLRWLMESGAISVRSAPQYLAAISMTHQAQGYLGFSAFDGATRRILRCWQLQRPLPTTKHLPVHVSTWCEILSLGLRTADAGTLRACASATFDFVFFNRAVSGHLIALDDVVFQDTAVVFRERRTKL
ncbi:MAG: hypothetical protein MI867_15345, partial [Pseudomonadales bacterium]|nr:hypothetical protein [Pseudomonadales bacterium]